MKTRMRIIIGIALFAASAHADQNAPELDDLFASLQRDLTSHRAVDVTNEIWRHWLHTDDAALAALMHAGMRDMRSDRLVDAVAQFTDAIDLAPDYAEAWNKRATAYYMMGRFDLSAADVVRTLKLEPRHFGALTGQGMMHMQQNNAEAALDYFERALEVNPHIHNVKRYIEFLRGEMKKKVI